MVNVLKERVSFTEQGVHPILPVCIAPDSLKTPPFIFSKEDAILFIFG